MLDVTVSTYVPGERSKSPNPRVQSWHASSVSLLVRGCWATPRTPCPPLAGSMFAPSLQHPQLRTLQHPLAPNLQHPPAPSRRDALLHNAPNLHLDRSQPAPPGRAGQPGPRNAAWALNAGPDWGESQGNSCLEWGIEDWLWSGWC